MPTGMNSTLSTEISADVPYAKAAVNVAAVSTRSTP